MICQCCQDYYFPKENWTPDSNLSSQMGSMQGVFWQSSSSTLTKIGKQSNLILVGKVQYIDMTWNTENFPGRHKTCFINNQRREIILRWAELTLNWYLLAANSTAAHSSFSGKILTQGLAFSFFLHVFYKWKKSVYFWAFS
jgi:hypothetical protein